jgi:copper(I)-binding protein
MRRLASLLIAIVLALPAPAPAHSYKVGNVMVGHVWAQPTAGNSTEAYVSLLNRAPQGDQLVSVLAPTAQSVAFVNPANQRIGAVDLPPNRPVALKPGALRIVIVGLDRPVRVGDKIKLTLVFARAGSVQVEALVEAGPSHG